MTVTEITIPDIGHFTEVEVIEVAIKPGVLIQAEDTLITLETEKATMDVPSPLSGTIQEVKVKIGDKVAQGSLIALVKIEEALPLVAPLPLPPTQEVKVVHVASTPSVKEEVSEWYAGPATRRLAREVGIDLQEIAGSGRKGRITTKDVHDFIKSALNQGASVEKMPQVDFSQFGEIEVKPLTRVKKWTAKNLHRNWVNIPHVTQFDEADITELEHFRQQTNQQEKGTKLTPLPFIIKAVVASLKAYGQFNASLSANGDDLICKNYYHIGVAMDTPNGLVVPVIKEANKKSLLDLATELTQLSQQARSATLKVEQMQGSCFSISSLGGVGGTAFTPIINAPDVAILGISKVQIKPIFIDGQFVPRKILPLQLSYDHRVIDGVEAAKFMTHLVMQLQEIRNLLL